MRELGCAEPAPKGLPPPRPAVGYHHHAGSVLSAGDSVLRAVDPIARSPPPPSIRADEEEDRRHQWQQDRSDDVLAGEQEGQSDDGADGQRQLGSVADEKLPPEVTEGPDGPG